MAGNSTHLDALRERPIPQPDWLHTLRKYVQTQGYDLAVYPGNQTCRFGLLAVPLGDCRCGPDQLARQIVAALPVTGHFPPKLNRPFPSYGRHDRHLWEVEMYGQEMYRFELCIYPSREPINPQPRLR